MNFCILDSYKEDDRRLVKDTAGRYGADNDIYQNYLNFRKEDSVCHVQLTKHPETRDRTEIKIYLLMVWSLT